MSSHGRKRVGEPYALPFIRALTLFLRAPPSWPNYCPKAPPPSIITLGLGFQHMNFGRSQILSPWHCASHPLMKVRPPRDKSPWQVINYLSSFFLCVTKSALMQRKLWKDTCRVGDVEAWGKVLVMVRPHLGWFPLAQGVPNTDVSEINKYDDGSNWGCQSSDSGLGPGFSVENIHQMNWTHILVFMGIWRWPH